MTTTPGSAEPDFADTVVICCHAVSKAFGRVQALDSVDLEVRRGEIVAVVGENGAGKTTLMRIIARELAPDTGSVQVGESVALVRQELSMASGLSVLENIVFGAEPTRRLGVIDWGTARRRVAALTATTGLDVPLGADAARVPPALQQRAELLRALYRGARVLLLDEPTSYLTPRDVDKLFEVVRSLVAGGISAVFISHKLREVAEHCDRVSVLRGGRNAGQFADRPFSLRDIGRAMTGDGALPAGSRRAAPTAHGGQRPVALSAANGRLDVGEGEIVGVAGVAGSGQDLLVDTVVGLRRHQRYEPVSMLGENVTRWKVRARRARGLRVIPASVRASGCAVNQSLTANILTSEVPAQARGRLGALLYKNAAQLTEQVIASSQVVTVGPGQPASELSGGNLQRLVVGRELGSHGRVLVAHEPTRGVDYRAAAEIRERIRGFAEAGGAVLLISSDLEELLELSDAVHVLYAGNLSASYPVGTLTLGKLGELLGGLSA